MKHGYKNTLISFYSFSNRPNGKLLEIDQFCISFSQKESNTSFQLLEVCDLYYITFQSLHFPVHCCLSYSATIDI